jgi:hypothetical protein
MKINLKSSKLINDVVRDVKGRERNEIFILLKFKRDEKRPKNQLK